MKDGLSTSIRDRYQEILSKISHSVRSGPSQNNTSAPVLIAVSKHQSIDAIEALYRIGHRDFGENYAQELIEKAIELNRRGCEEIRWHFIGHLQTNKVKMILPYVSYIHTVDSLKLAAELSKRWMSSGRKGKLSVFIEVNVDQEDSKSGFVAEGLPSEISELSKLPDLDFQGLMCIPSSSGDARSAFKRLRELEHQCRPLTQGMLSMGMSQDFELAIQEGATHVRVGTAIFGARTSTSTH